MPDKADELKKSFLYEHCLPEWRDLVALKQKTLSLKKGSTIFDEGDKVNGIYFLLEGAVKVHKKWGEQRELIVRFAKTGDVLGHRGIGSNHHFPVSATCLEDCKLSFITNDFLEATLQTNPGFTYQLMHLYAQELQKSDQRMHDLALMEVKGRIALALLELKNLFGLDTEKFISVAVSRQDIASYAGTTYETVFKFFTSLIADNIISSNGKRIRINNASALQNFVNPPVAEKN